MRRLLNARPGGGARFLLGLLPILALALLYLGVASARHSENPRDKITPIPAAMAEAVQTMAFEVDPRTGEVPLVADTKASLRRLGIAMGLAAATTLVLGLVIGLFPYVNAGLGPVTATISVIPPIAVLPILFIVFGLGEVSKIVLIFVGVTPVMVRDLAGHVRALPEEQIVKAQTLGAGAWLTLIRVALPQALPRLIENLRLSLCPAWVYLISAEAIAADVGLGYRIFLVRRYLSMDIILPYVVWITLLAVIMDLALVAWSRGFYGWAHPPEGALMSALSFRNVWVEYGDKIVLEKVDLDIEDGAFVSIIGPSGAGKTTFLRLALGQEAPSRGRILLDGEPLAPEPGPDRGVVFQRYSVFPHLNALQNVMFGPECSGARLTGRLSGKAKRQVRDEARALLDRVGLGHNLKTYPAALSGGMQQRLAIAQALITRPRILLLDEPFGALDPGVRLDMHELILELWREHKLTILMVTHDIKEAFKLGSRVVAFDKRRHDPQAPNRYGSTAVYDFPLDEKKRAAIPPEVAKIAGVIPESA